MNLDWYRQVTEQKRKWSPVCGSPLPVREGSESVLGRILAARILELDVAAWLADGICRESLPDPVVAALQSNIADETRHDTVLAMADNAFGLTTEQDRRDAEAIKQEWECHPDHPITKAFVLENSVFFVILPFMRMFGDPNLRVVARDISGDETAHAAIHRQLAKDLGLTYSHSLDNLRRRTVQWIFDGLRITDSDKGSPDVWIQSSDSLLERGVASQLRETRRSVMPAFFETSNATLPKYN